MTNGNKAAELIVALIPIVGIVMGSVVVFFHLLWNHRRTMLLIQTGKYVSRHFDFDTFSLFTGLLLTVVGTCLTVFLAIFTKSELELLGGVLPLGCGCALLIFFIVNRVCFHHKS
jgi:hypothetical protein